MLYRAKLLVNTNIKACFCNNPLFLRSWRCVSSAFFVVRVVSCCPLCGVASSVFPLDGGGRGSDSGASAEVAERAVV